MSFKLYGYDQHRATQEDCAPLTLAEVTLVATPHQLREIADFLLSAAAEMQAQGDSWEHQHLSDCKPAFAESPHFIVYKPRASEQPPAL